MSSEGIIQIDRTVHTSSTGIEIIRTFHVEPYARHTEFIDSLQGKVEDGKRVLPARDTWITNCFCNECEVNFADRRVMASSPSLSGEDTIMKGLVIKEDTADGAAGAIVKAHYRPLVTAWESTEIERADGKVPDQAFDWMDPTFTPGMREIPWPTGLFIRVDRPPPFMHANVPAEVGSSFSVPIENITLRRILVDKIPEKEINACMGAVNEKEFPPNPARAPGFPKCRPRTLRFLPPTYRHMMDSKGHRWYEIIYNFTRIVYWSDKVMDSSGKNKPDWITWNHVFMQPLAGPLGWYPVQTERQPQFGGVAIPDFIPGFPLRAGRLHNEADFAMLFPGKGN